MVMRVTHLTHVPVVVHLCQVHGLAGHVHVVEIHEVGELVVSSDVSVVGRESHQEVDQGEDDEDAGGGGHEEHQLRVLDKINTELLDLQLALHSHVDVLGALREEEVERVEVNDSFPPLNLLCAADT